MRWCSCKLRLNSIELKLGYRLLLELGDLYKEYFKRNLDLISSLISIIFLGHVVLAVVILVTR